MSDTGYRIREIELVDEYHEESLKLPLFITVLVLMLVLGPMIFWIVRINRDGTESKNITQYEALVAVADANVKSVGSLLRHDTQELEAIRESNRKEVVTLVVPEVVIVEQRVDQKDSKSLKAEVDGIYYVKGNPLASIGGDTYRVGDKVQGYEIIHISKTTVRLKSPDGTIVVKDMYGDLFHNKK